ncbi:acyl-CoA thioesterase, variant 2 [Batrachochytrium dendrobatidis]
MVMEDSAQQTVAPIELALDLEYIDSNLYRSKQLWTPAGNRGVFGGQVVGLALSAAAKTVDSKFQVHSLHSYFLLAGDHSLPIIYRVYRIRDGKSYASRTVTARQRGRVIFMLMCSFQVEEFSPLAHQYDMPNVPLPESLKSTEQRLREWLEDPRAEKYHKTIQMRLEQPIAVDIRPVGHRRLNLDSRDPIQMVWMRAIGRLPDGIAFHHCVAAYCSDHELLNTSLIPHGLARLGGHRKLTMLTSLDHAIVSHSMSNTS